MAKKTQPALRDLVSRGVDRVPARYRVAPPRPTWIHLHTSPSRLMVRLTAASRGELNVPYTNPDRDAKSLRSGRLRKELQRVSAHASTDREFPEVSVSTADTVVLELAPSDAQTLARVLAHYDAIARWARQREADGKDAIPVVDGFEPEVWQHVLIHLIAEAQNARLQITAPTVIVPFRTTGAHR